jgi:[ribosomal protein S5]-alanine N-acetyltransferase
MTRPPGPLAYPGPPLADAAVRLRTWAAADTELVRRAAADAYVATIEHVPAPPVSDEEGQDWIAHRRAAVGAARGWELVIEDADGQPLGGIGMALRHPPGAAEPGCWVLPEHRGRGIAARATRLLCRWALTAETGISRIQATVEPRNVPARHVLEGVGFVREGYLRGYASYDRQRRDVLYALLASDLEPGG